MSDWTRLVTFRVCLTLESLGSVMRNLLFFRWVTGLLVCMAVCTCLMTLASIMLFVVRLCRLPIVPNLLMLTNSSVIDLWCRCSCRLTWARVLLSTNVLARLLAFVWCLSLPCVVILLLSMRNDLMTLLNLLDVVMKGLTRRAT